MKFIYLVIEKNKQIKENSRVVAVCLRYTMAHSHKVICEQEADDKLKYEIVTLTLDDVEKLIGAVHYLKNKIKEKANVLRRN